MNMNTKQEFCMQGLHLHSKITLKDTIIDKLVMKNACGFYVRDSLREILDVLLTMKMMIILICEIEYFLLVYLGIFCRVCLKSAFSVFHLVLV